MNLPACGGMDLTAQAYYQPITELCCTCVYDVFLIYYVYKCKEDKGKPNISSRLNKKGLFIKLFMRIFKENLDI